MPTQSHPGATTVFHIRIEVQQRVQERSVSGPAVVPVRIHDHPNIDAAVKLMDLFPQQACF